ncbi:DUF3284 domain-containing protein [Phocoenobacter skyensis]|uniref:DUF3284 domain-containing protein n=1 Tax=Phocoenobacter skyensis TaxID=97481 RepID=A0A1H7VB71_9PAST|nr:DUF3284 domain-containing protein [Pasteurella skyensis]MDP8078378.1 DUF3284 domain-containing protein [Pasteurella skyensis]MDP8084530.1 DUF3284 domain-containing protein [Pasteurella skyensis]MDP8174387.1 DUF3284 domain-containing protein [Pasteurella skyensis]MDP8184345.1 DUF3284 domain-containing protein [Pasteurella skyensis]QLB23369.1 hypothetical protein A6B44_09200 [Pasteurella skyensis]
MQADYYLSVSPQQLHHFLIQNFCKEMGVQAVTSGQEFTQKIGKKEQQSYRVIVKNCQQYDRFTLEYHTNLGINIVDYHITPQQNGVNVHYSEEYHTDKFLYKTNYWLVGSLWQWFFLRKKRRLFKQIEQYILQEQK